jgi:hypothetical protein
MNYRSHTGVFKHTTLGSNTLLASEVWMLDKIYKYTAIRTEFFDNLMIRASQKYALNDPFELRPSHNPDNSGADKNAFSTLSDESYFDYAVVSLSETNNNLLMWSHYAEQHQGMVIEFDSSKPLFDDYRHFEKTKEDPELEELVIDEEETLKREIINTGIIQRVRYNALRPQLDNFESILEHFLVKSEEWIYEKEHRVILPLVLSDKVIVNNKYLSEIEDLSYNPESLEKKCIGNDMYLINFKDPLICEYNAFYNYSSPYVPDETLRGSFVESVIYEFLQKISEDPTTVFLYKVPPSSIKSVYLGCRVDENIKNEVLDKIKSNPKLSHVSVFQGHTSKERFELNFSKLTS